MSLTFISNHVQKARNRILSQYKGKQRIQDTIDAFVAEVQALEDAFEDIHLERGIETATGATLDKIGSIVGLERTPGDSDDDYRYMIKSKVVQNLNEGTPEEVIAAAKFFLGATFLAYIEVYPAEVDIYSSETLDPEIASAVRTQIERFLPASVSLGVLGTVDPEKSFIFDGGLGFGDTNDPEVGGLLAGIY